MGTIYRRATEVEAWISDADEDSAKAMDLIARDEHEGSEEHADSLIKFLERPYWRRIWII